MITETYKGRKIRIVKGRGQDFGYSRVTLNGTELGKWLGDEERVLQSLHGYIDVTDRTGINGDKYGVEWYAPGTFEVCENGHPKEIGGGCLHSYCIERRPVPAATEPTTPRHTTIRISDRMAEALRDTEATADRIRLLLSTRAGTTVALMQRGLVKYDRELTRENGYEVHTLTPRGLNVRERLIAQPDGREFLSSVVDAAALKAEPVREAMAKPEVTEYSVKIWYRSGAYEGAPHCLEDLARKIYADAVKSPGVEFAELHGPSGVLVESKVPADDRDAVSDTLVMRPSPEWRPVLVTETLIRRCCFCQGDKQVHHHTALAMPVCHDCAVFVSA